MGNIRILLLVVIFGVFPINFYPETENSSLLVFGISASDNNNIINTSAQPGANQTNSPLDLLVQDFAVIMIVATVMLLISFKLKQSAVIGYIIAGMVIGPYTPPFSLIHNLDTLNAFAELGIIMLLFVIGIDFPINRLRQVGRISAIVAVAESMGTLLITFVVAQFLGFSYFDSLFIALALSITSTAVTLKVPEELNMIKNQSTTLLLGISIVEDTLAIAILGILQSVVTQEGNASFVNLIPSILIVGAFIGGTLFIGSRLVPKLVDRISKVNDYALVLISILGVAFFLSFLAKSVGLSVATGAFFAGVLIAEARSASVARVITTPLRDMFAALFFISIGALMDISLIPAFIVPALILIAVSLSSKLAIVSGGPSLAKYGKTTALRTGIGMSAARGELSLVVAKVGQDTGAVSNSVFPILGVVTILTTFITPYMLKLGKRISFKSDPGESSTTSQVSDQDKDKDNKDSTSENNN
ncbi:cation:proton antiporter [Candidatus Nitrosocosmicus sp. FF01]|uniref:cation:proton antiporter domain-containing protein n=1 Tax=Candidatus Nitrosocosmicus sp. FF01 TaxID=3397670 RepID=UPI0039E98700